MPKLADPKIFQTGYCQELAAALSSLSGWRTAAIVETHWDDNAEEEYEVPIHWVCLPQRRGKQYIADAKGIRALSQILPHVLMSREALPTRKLRLKRLQIDKEELNTEALALTHTYVNARRSLWKIPSPSTDGHGSTVSPSRRTSSSLSGNTRMGKEKAKRTLKPAKNG